MSNLSINIWNNTQKSLLLFNKEEFVIEEVTSYLREDGEVSKHVLQREVYNRDTSLEALLVFFNSQLNALLEFYRVRGEFSIEINGV